MTKVELAEMLMQKFADCGVNNRVEANTIIDTFSEIIMYALRDEGKVEIRGFAVFKTRERKPKKARNPRTGDSVNVPAKKVPFFKIGKEFKDMLIEKPVGAKSDKKVQVKE